MKNFNKIVAFGLAASMMVGSAMTAFAAGETTQDLTSSSAGVVAGAEQTVTGEGTENYINKKVFKVTVPTSAEAAKVFAFYTDPQGLISATNAAQVGENITITDDTGVFFKNVADGNTSISSWSDPLQFVNKSTSGVSIGLKVKLKEAASDKYAAGYSTTADFSGDNDGTTGLYMALYTTGLGTVPLTATETTKTSLVKSAYDLYKVTYTASGDNAGYHFDIPAEDAGKAPVFEIYANGALNRQLADTTWYKVTENQPLTAGAALAMPDIEVKYTPTYVDSKQCKATVDATALYVWNYDDTPFAAEAALTTSSLTINGKTATTTVTKCDSEGYLVIPIAEVYTALGLTTEADKTLDNVKDLIQGVGATVGGVAVYANVD